jgi:hypothetical protein
MLRRKRLAGEMQRAVLGKVQVWIGFAEEIAILLFLLTFSLAVITAGGNASWN